MMDNMINNYEIEMKMLAGKPIEIYPNLKIHKVSFSDVSDIGYFKYSNIIRILCMDDDALKTELKVDDADVYKYIVSLATYAVEYKDNDRVMFLSDLINVFKYIFRENVLFNYQERNFCVGENGVLYRGNFEDFKRIIKIRNCLENIESDSENPANEMAKQLLEKRKKAREKLSKAKQSSEGGELTLLDLIGIYAEAEHMKLEDVFEYDMFQFNNQFNRMKIFRDYDINIQALLAGAKSDDINLKHWMSKLKTDN